MLKWIEIHREALISNLLSLRGLLLPSTRLLLVVKANAYGHGWRQISAICEEKNLVDWYGAHSVEEGLAIRAAGIKRPVLVLGYVESSMWNEALKADLRLTVFDQASLRGIDRTAKKLGLQASVHLKVETGTGRQGILEEQWPAMAETFKTLGNVILEGLSTHYANKNRRRGLNSSGRGSDGMVLTHRLVIPHVPRLFSFSLGLTTRWLGWGSPPTAIGLLRRPISLFFRAGRAPSPFKGFFLLRDGWGRSKICLLRAISVMAFPIRRLSQQGLPSFPWGIAMALTEGSPTWATFL